MSAPLADRLRPQALDEIVGQKHLLGGEAAAQYYPFRRAAQPRFLWPLRRWENNACRYHRPNDEPPPAPAQRHNRLHGGYPGCCCGAGYVCCAQWNPFISG